MKNKIINKIAVIKFGSSVLTQEADIATAIHEVYRYVRQYYKVIVVVSAIGTKTNDLDNSIKYLFSDKINPQPKSYAELLSTGEIASAALFTMALIEAGIQANSISHACLMTTGNILDADPLSLKIAYIMQLFKKHPVLVIPGFIGTDKDSKCTSLLGRGGSDFSATFIAWKLKADTCILYKDTNGIYEDDPTTNQAARHYATLTYDDCLKLPYPVIQHKALLFSKKKNLNILVKTLGTIQQTLVSHQASKLNHLQVLTKPKRLKVVLLGLGTVGLGVYHYLSHANQWFEIIGIGIKDDTKNRPDFIPKNILLNDLSKVVTQADILIELIGEPETALTLITAALKAKCHVVTANKLLIAKSGETLSHLAKANGVTIHYSAAVGGAVPVLEILTHLRKNRPQHKIESLCGILNGTSNYILDKVSQGETFDQAIRLAQQAGFAEADPSLDINGLDAAHKLTIISRLAFNKNLREPQVECIEKHALKGDQHTVIKQIAQCKRIGNQFQVSVKPTSIPLSHPLANITGENNSILIKTTQGEVIQLSGKGAGRWPTALAVFADIWDIALQHARNKRA